MNNGELLEDELLEQAAAILERRGYPQTALNVLWAIGRADGILVVDGQPKEWRT